MKLSFKNKNKHRERERDENCGYFFYYFWYLQKQYYSEYYCSYKYNIFVEKSGVKIVDYVIKFFRIYFIVKMTSY